MSEVLDPWEAHKTLRAALGTAAAGDAFADMVRANDPRHEFSAKGLFRAIQEITYQDFDIFPQAMIYPTPEDGAKLKTIEPFVRGALKSLMAVATLYETPAYKPVVGFNTAQAYVEAIESAWTKTGMEPSLQA